MHSFPEMSFDWTSFVLLTTGISKALAASVDMTKEILPKSNMHPKGKYFPL
jgi:hypothetical protein